VLKILIPAFSSPALLDIQLRAIKAYLPAAEIWVVIDSKHHLSGSFRRKMRTKALEYTEHVILFPPIYHFMRRRIFPSSEIGQSRNPSMRHADVLQFAFEKMNAGGDFQLMILDEDLVPFRSWDPKLEFGQQMIGCYVGQERSNNDSMFTYPWPGFFYVDMSLSRSNELVSWDTFVNNEIRLDTGGAMLNWLDVNKDRMIQIETLNSNHWSVQETDIDFPKPIRAFLEVDSLPTGKNFAEIYAGSFIHLRGASNWFKQDSKLHQERLNYFCHSFDALLQ
jgi:hypothetical protein